MNGTLKHHTKSGLIEEVKNSKISIKDAEEATLNFIKSYSDSQKVHLCGNSIWVDRFFMRRYMPELNAYFHYRLIDVSSIKELCKRWYPNSPFLKFKKSDSHRSLQDARESVKELKYYRTHFFLPPFNFPEK